MCPFLILLYYSPHPMERWAANTLRTLGIILTAGLVLVTCLFFLLLSVCAAGPSIGGSPGNHSEAALYAVIAAIVAIAGVTFIVWLARGIVRTSGTADDYWPTPPAERFGTIPPVPQPAAQLQPPAPRVPLHLSPQSRQTLDRLVLALGAQIALSALSWIINQLHFWSAPHAFAPHNWTLLLLAPFVLYHIPYAVLIYLLLKKPSRFALTYALAVPAVLVLQSLFSLSVVSYYHVHQPTGLVLLVLPWLLHILILVLAYQAIQQVGLHPEPSSLIVAAIASFFYFSVIQTFTTIFYRFAPK